MENYYSVLEISPTASFDEIKEAYRALVKMCHPDHNDGNRFAQEKFKRIQSAYEILSDPQKRNDYDSQLRQYKNKSQSQDYNAYYDGYRAGQEDMYRQENEKHQQETYEAYSAGFRDGQEKRPQKRKSNIGAGILAGAAIVAGVVSEMASASASADMKYADSLSSNNKSKRSNTINNCDFNEERKRMAYSAAKGSSVFSSMAKCIAGILGGLALSKFLKDK